MVRPIPPLFALFAIAALLAVGCERQPPLTRARAVVIADNVQRAEGVDWGDPLEVLPPGDAEADGRRWWQLRYRPGPDGASRLILVDHDTGWGRLPPTTWRQRVAPAHPTPPASTAAFRPAAALAEGSWILVLDPHAAGDAARDGDLAREAMRLNALAGQTGLYPAFAVHRDRAGRSALVYGWQGDRGMTRDTGVSDWVAIRTGRRDARWVDLLAP